MSKSPLFRVLVVTFITSAVVAAGIWVVSEPGDISVKAAVTIDVPKPYGERIETQSSLATLTIDGRVQADEILLKKLVADAHLKMADHAKDAAETWVLMGKGSQRQLDFEIDWTIAFENDRLISLHESTYDNGGGAHPNSYLNSLLWDKRHSKAIRLADLLKNASENSAALEMISTNLFEQWKTDFKEKSNLKEIDAYSLEWAQKGLAPKESNFGTFVLTAGEGAEGMKAKGLTFLFSPYALSAYVFGSFSFEVSASALHPYLADEWKNEFK